MNTRIGINNLAPGRPCRLVVENVYDQNTGAVLIARRIINGAVEVDGKLYLDIDGSGRDYVGVDEMLVGEHPQFSIVEVSLVDGAEAPAQPGRRTAKERALLESRATLMKDKTPLLEMMLDDTLRHLHRLDQATTEASDALTAAGVPEVDAGRCLTLAERIERLHEKLRAARSELTHYEVDRKQTEAKLDRIQDSVVRMSVRLDKLEVQTARHKRHAEDLAVVRKFEELVARQGAGNVTQRYRAIVAIQKALEEAQTNEAELAAARKGSTMIETELYSLGCLDEAAAELKAKAQGLTVTRAGWEIVDGDKRFAPADVVGCVDLDKVIAHAKREIALAKDPRLSSSILPLGDKEQIRFKLEALLAPQPVDGPST